VKLSLIVGKASCDWEYFSALRVGPGFRLDPPEPEEIDYEGTL
jgi:hypothetical protein